MHVIKQTNVTRSQIGLIASLRSRNAIKLTHIKDQNAFGAEMGCVPTNLKASASPKPWSSRMCLQRILANLDMRIAWKCQVIASSYLKFLYVISINNTINNWTGVIYLSIISIRMAISEKEQNLRRTWRGLEKIQQRPFTNCWSLCRCMFKNEFVVHLWKKWLRKW